MRTRTIPMMLALVAALAACSGNITELAVGDCFDDVAGLDGEAEVTDVPIVDCAEPHDNEVFHTFDLEGDEYPGEDAALAEAETRCLDAYEAYVGTAYDDSRLDFFAIYPTQQSWEGADDRTAICSLFDSEMEQLTGSMRGSGE